MVRAKEGKAGGSAASQEGYQELLRGGEMVSAVLKDMADLLEEIPGFDEGEMEQVAIQVAAAGAVGGKIEVMDRSFLLAIDFMIKESEKEGDSYRKALLEAVKEQVLLQLSEKLPAEARVVSLLVSTPDKQRRRDVVSRAVAGGGVFPAASGGKVTIPGASVEAIVKQADSLVESIEESARVEDRRLLSRLVLARESARDMMGGGILDSRNAFRGFQSISEAEVNLLSELLAMGPTPATRERLRDVLRGGAEGRDIDEEAVRRQARRSSGPIKSRLPKVKIGTVEQEIEPVPVLPIRPGRFLDSVTKMIGGIYKEGGASRAAVQQLEWVRRTVFDILEEMASN